MAHCREISELQPTSGNVPLDASPCHGARPELLAPAGGWEQLRAAVRFGADAVYLACDRFGMRARADNFTLDELPQAVEFAHRHDVAVHVAANTLMDADDIAALPAFFEAVAEAGADQLIVADMGAFSLARRHAPQVGLCVSTQASVTNAEAARMWHDLGAHRVVCAREMSLAAIAQLRRDAPPDLEIEAFVHGAMCVAYSGRCLLSAAMTGRSGNKGACAQSCRWSYGLVEEQRPGEVFPIEQDARGTYILNAQDLNMAAHVDALMAAGVDSFKIEGRNKRAFYVATVVGAYRGLLDGTLSAAAAEAELDTISHRPYGTGFYFGAPTQTLERDGYVKECLHVATVEAVEVALAGVNAAGEEEAGASAGWDVTVLCHNRFWPGDELGIVSPTGVGRTLAVGPLWWHGPADGGVPFVERGRLTLDQVRAQSRLTPASVANRTRERYVFRVPAAGGADAPAAPIAPGDYLRRPLDATEDAAGTHA